MSDLTPVTSSNIDSVGYNQKKSVLVVKFKSGKLYAYEGVPLAIYNAFITAGSKGGYFGKAIRNVFQSQDITNMDLQTFLGTQGMARKKAKPTLKPLTFEELMSGFGGMVQAFF